MDETTLQEMLNEINSMTAEEYWKLFEESRKLPDFLPVIFLPEWESVPATALPDAGTMCSDISFSTDYKESVEVFGSTHYPKLEDIIWLQAA
jgi:hypothetical protein